MVLVGKELSSASPHILVQLLERRGRSELKLLGKHERSIAATQSYHLRKNLGFKELNLLKSCHGVIVIDDVMTTGSTFDRCVDLVGEFVDMPVIGLCLAMD